MAITIVGTAQVGAGFDGAGVTLTFDVEPEENDVVVVTGGHGNSGTTDDAGPTTAGYEEFFTPLSSSNMNVGAWWKVMGETPDADVATEGGIGSDANAYAAFVLRGVDTSQVSDATPITPAEGSGADPDPGAIVTATDGALVIATAHKRINFAADGGITGYSNFVTAGANDTIKHAIAAATKEVATAGSEDPGAYDWPETNAHQTITLAIRPAGGAAPNTRRYSLTLTGIG